MDFMTFLGPTFTMEVPTNWFIASNAQYQAVFTDPSEKNGFQPNLMLSIRPVQANVAVDAIAESAKQTQSKEYPAYKVLEEQIEAKEPARVKRVYTWQHPESKQDFQQVQFFTIENQMLYTLTGTRLLNGGEESIVDKVFNHMINSFEFSS